MFRLSTKGGGTWQSVNRVRAVGGEITMSISGTRAETWRRANEGGQRMHKRKVDLEDVRRMHKYLTLIKEEVVE